MAKCCIATSPRGERQVQMPISINSSHEGGLFESGEGSVFGVKVKEYTCLMTESDLSADGMDAWIDMLQTRPRVTKKRAWFVVIVHLMIKVEVRMSEEQSYWRENSISNILMGCQLTSLGYRYLGCISVPQASGNFYDFCVYVVISPVPVTVEQC